MAHSYLQLIYENCSGGLRGRACAFAAVDSGLITREVKPMTLKLVFAASLLDVLH